MWRRIAFALAALVFCGFSLKECKLYSLRRLEEEEKHYVRITLDYPRLVSKVSKEGLAATIRFLSSLRSRIAGYPDNYRAAKFVERTFRRIGLRNVRREYFTVPVAVERYAFIELPPEVAREAGLPRKVRIYSLWPNLVRTTTLPPEGLTAPLIYAGYADLKEFSGKDVQGSIVLLEFNCGSHWLNAPLLGAKAVLFIEPEKTQRGEGEAKFLSLPLNMPRFWVPREAGLKLKALCERSKKPPRITLKARMDWVERWVYNVLADLPGTDPKLRKERVVISAYFDSISVVPSLAPGAQTACGIAALFEVAKALKAYPPKRPVTFLATNAHFIGMEGVKQFFWKRLKTIKEKGDEGKAEVAWAFLALDLTSQGRRFGAFYKGHFFDYTEEIQRRYADYGKQLEGYAEEVSQALGLKAEDWYVNAISPVQGKEWRTYIPGQIALESEVAVIAGCPGLGILTVNDSRQYVDTPLDTFDKVDLDALYHQVRVLTGFIARLCNEMDRKIELKDFELNFCRVSGRVVEFDPRVSYLPEKPVSGALAVCRTLPTGFRTYMGVRGILIRYTDKKGKFEFVGVPLQRVRPHSQVRIEAYKFRKRDGELIFAPDLGAIGAEKFPITMPVDVEDKQLQVVVFKCRSMAIFDTIDQRYFDLLKELYVYDASTNAAPVSYGFSLPIRQPWFSFYEPCALIYAPPDVAVKVTMGASQMALQAGKGGGLGALRLILINADKDHPLGKGFVVGKTPVIPLTPLRAVKDMWLRDEDWLRRLRRHGIENLRVKELHEAARRKLEEAEKALKEKRYDVALAAARAAWGFESDAYPAVKKTANDVVKGVIFYLMLLLPFAFFAERLFFAFPDIRKQIPAALGIFILVFLLLRYVHPAFEITTAPLVVLEAFIILALALLVTIIVINKFEEQMRQMKFATTGIHQADVGRLSAAAAAFNLGISNMRRRKARTFLTCITLILLTFTVLSFTSVVSTTRKNLVKLPHKPSYKAGILIRDRTWAPLGEPTDRMVKSEFGDKAVVVPRVWFFSAMVGQQSFVDVERKGKIYSAYALLGLSPDEPKVTGIDRFLSAGRWFKQGERFAAIVPTRMAKLLDIKPSEVEAGTAKIRVLGVDLPVVGIIDSERFKRFEDLDGEQLTPVDYLLMEQQQQQQRPITKEEIREYLHLQPDATLIVPHTFLIAVGGGLRSVAMKFKDEKTAWEALRHLMERVELNLYASKGDKVYLCSAVGMTTMRGVHSVFIPILIAALIVLNTMLGAVYERVREIGTYSAVGLAPIHVAALFLAESAVYAILGAIAGYVIGQLLSKVIVTFNLFPGLNLNYSSLSAVGTILIVMVVVLLSTIYPAKKASEMCVPGVERRWRLPEPQDDRLVFDLPFTVAADHAPGLNAFLKEYMEAHADYSLGQFSTDKVDLTSFETDKGPAYRLESTVWLAPYDLGVSERLTLETVPTDDPGVYKITIQIRRLSGEEASWLRVTRGFLNGLRKQFLIWRVLKPELKENYIKRAKEAVSVAKTRNV